MKNIAPIKKKCAIYVRVSTEEQAKKGISLSAQVDRCKAFLESRDWMLFNVYKDAGFSAGSMERPAFQLMMRDAQAKKIDIILVYKIDRFSRRVKDLLQSLETLKSLQIDFSSVTEQFDTTTAMGEAFFQIIGVFAELERKTIAERVSLTFGKKINDGQSVHRAPLGYKYKNKRLVIETQAAEKVKSIFELWSLGVHYKEISRRVDVPVSTLYQIIKNPLYIGKIRYRGELYPGKHTPIIDENLFNALQEKNQTTIKQFYTTK